MVGVGGRKAVLASDQYDIIFTMDPIFLADLIRLIHFLYVLCVILPVPLILIGEFYKWGLVRNSWFRNIHLGMIGIIIIQSLFGIVCPWTIWEDRLRMSAGAEGYHETFISYWVGRLLYYDYELWIFTVVYIIFGLIVLLLYILFPPKWLSQR